MAQIVREQVGRISDEFASKRGITVGISADAGAAFMYAADQILVREEKIQQVQEVLGKSVRTEQPEEVIPGLQLLRLGPGGPFVPRPSVRVVLRQIEEQLGPDVAGEDHIVTVAGEAGPCPATEPEEVYFEIEPFPGVRLDNDGSDGSGVRVYVADTGLLADTTSHWWLKGVRGGPDPLEPRPGRFIKPYAGHGTFVAGVLRCMAPKADVFVSNVFKVAGSALESDFVRDLTQALNHGSTFQPVGHHAEQRDLRLLGFEAWLTLLRQHPGVACVVAPVTTASTGNSGRPPSREWSPSVPWQVTGAAGPVSATTATGSRSTHLAETSSTLMRQARISAWMPPTPASEGNSSAWPAGVAHPSPPRWWPGPSPPEVPHRQNGPGSRRLPARRRTSPEHARRWSHSLAVWQQIRPDLISLLLAERHHARGTYCWRGTRDGSPGRSGPQERRPRPPQLADAGGVAGRPLLARSARGPAAAARPVGLVAVCARGGWIPG